MNRVRWTWHRKTMKVTFWLSLHDSWLSCKYIQKLSLNWHMTMHVGSPTLQRVQNVRPLDHHSFTLPKKANLFARKYCLLEFERIILILYKHQYFFSLQILTFGLCIQLSVWCNPSKSWFIEMSCNVSRDQRLTRFPTLLINYQRQR